MDRSTRFYSRIITIFSAFGLIAFGMLGFVTQASAQMAPLEIPWVNEWASSAHARYNEEPFTHWNKDGAVPPACARCHTTTGYRDYIGDDGSAAGKVDKPHLTGQVVTCVACHNKTTRELTEVVFPSGIKIAKLGSEARCMTCHQGRESTVSMNKALKGLAEDTASKKIRFLNIHYRAAAATRYGTDVKGGFEYPNKAYAGLYVHDKNSTVCTDCHTLHTFRVDVVNCDLCHRKVKKPKDFHAIRRTKGDFNGNGDEKEGISKEIDGLHKALYGAIQKYAAGQLSKPIAYDSHAYPYFFNDKNVNGKIDKGEGIYPNRYQSWTPRLLKAAYNYQFVAKDPGTYAHNPRYVLQLLYDSLESLSAKTGSDMARLLRP